MTDTRFTVLDETQRHPDLVKWISLILRQVALTVNEITGLPLPPAVRFRRTSGSRSIRRICRRGSRLALRFG